MLLSSLAAVLLIFLERTEPPAVEVAERLEPVDPISTPPTAGPRAPAGQEATSSNADRLLPAVREPAAPGPEPEATAPDADRPLAIASAPAATVPEPAEPAPDADRALTTASAPAAAAPEQVTAAPDVDRPLPTVSRPAAAAPEAEPVRAPEQASANRLNDADTDTGADTAASPPGDVAVTADSGPTATEQPGLATEPVAEEPAGGAAAETAIAADTTLPAPTAPSLTIPHRGVMTDGSGTPLVGLVTTIFALYAEPSGGVPLWVDIKAVEAGAAGGYVVTLGGTTEFPADLFATGEPRWLGVQPDGEAELPRTLFTNELTTPPARDAVAPLDSRPLSRLVLRDTKHGARPAATRWITADAPPPARPAPPPPIPYRGIMADESGAPLVGLVSTIFAVYEAPTGGVPLWVDIKTVKTGGAGGYVVLLGGTTAFPVDLFATDKARWLGVQPDGEAERPRVPFTRTPCAPPGQACRPRGRSAPVVGVRAAR